MRKGTRNGMKKRGYELMIAAALIGGLTACGSAETRSAETGRADAEETKQEAADSGAVVSMESNSAERTMKSYGYDENAEKNAYMNALRRLYTNHVLPDGSDCGYDEYNDITINEFAVYDIDGDGRDELIIQYVSTYMAGMAAGIYGYDETTNTLREELLEFPALTFYNNGTIEAAWSHNQGLAGDFWPYTLYRYDQSTDTYVTVGMADAWDRSYWETDFDGNQFPTAIDKDGDGIVYYVISGEEYEQVAPVDFAEYNQWRNSYVGGAEAIYVPFVSLTQTNIRSIND